MELFALFEEVSDQYGTSRLVGIYDTKDQAFANESKTKRCFVQVLTLNALPAKTASYVRKDGGSK